MGKRDSLRIYKLCNGCVDKIITYGESVEIGDKFEEDVIVI